MSFRFFWKNIFSSFEVLSPHIRFFNPAGREGGYIRQRGQGAGVYSIMSFPSLSLPLVTKPQATLYLTEVVYFSG
jgi:hypothetical protein